MTWVILLIIALILLILFLKLGICVRYDEGVLVMLNVLFFRFTLFPKRKKINVKSFSAKGIKKRLKKDSAVIEKKKASEVKRKEQKDNKFSDILETIKLISDLLSAIVGRFLKYLRIKVARLNLVVATDDAAKTAMQYGLAVQGVQYVVAILDKVTNFSVERNGNISVDCDFCSEKPIIDLDISFSIRVWQALVLLIKAGVVFVMRQPKKKQ